MSELIIIKTRKPWKIQGTKENPASQANRAAPPGNPPQAKRKRGNSMPVALNKAKEAAKVQGKSGLGALNNN